MHSNELTNIFDLLAKYIGANEASLCEQIDSIIAMQESMNKKMDLIMNKLEIDAVSLSPLYGDRKFNFKKIEEFYFANPNKKGSFNDSSRENNFVDGQSIYKFEMSEKDKAEFYIVDKQSSIKLALSYRDISIDPVCASSNAYKFNSKNIRTLKKGFAEKKGEIWEVIDKSVIRYE